MNQYILRVKKLLPKSKFFRSISVLAGGTAIGQALVLLASPFITRLYTPEDFGLLAVYMSTLSMIGVIASLRYELAIPLPEENKTAANIVVLSIANVFIVTSLIGFLVWVFGRQFVTLVNTPELSYFLWLIPIGVFGLGIYQILNYWAVRIQAFKYIAKTKINQAISLIFIQVCFGLAKFGAAGLLIGYCAGQIAGFTTLANLAWKNEKEIFKSVKRKEIISVARRYKNFPLFSTWSALANSGGLFLPPLLLASLYDSQVAGWFSLGLRTIQFPLAFIAQSFSQVYLGEASKLAKTDYRKLIGLFIKTGKTLFIIGLIPVFISLFSPSLFTIIFGKDWYQSGIYVQRLSFMFLIQFTVSPLSMTLNILERQELQALWDIFRLILVLSTFIIAKINNLSPVDSITIYGLTMAISYCLLFIMSMWEIKRRIKIL